MPTIEIKGMHEVGFRLVKRDFSGGVEVDYTELCPITDEEAFALVEVGYISAPNNEIRPSRHLPPIDPRSLLSVEQVELYDDLEVTRLVLRLPAMHNREEIMIIDPHFAEYPSLLDTTKWVQQIRFQHATDDTLLDTSVVEEWPDNPAEAVAFW